MTAPDEQSRGYANLGIGAYLINHSRAGELPELCISFASEEDRRTRTVGDSVDNAPDSEVRAEEMVVRIRFANEAGLVALEKQLAWVHSVHFADTATKPDSAPNGLTDAEIVAIRDDHLPSQGEAFDCIAFARAVIAALKPDNAVPREPTEAMIDAAYEAGLRGVDDTDDDGAEDSARAIWRAMYAAAKAGEGET